MPESENDDLENDVTDPNATDTELLSDDSEEVKEELEEEEEDEKEGQEEEKEETKDEATDEDGSIVSFRDLKKAYPDIFKKFPALAQTLQRDRAFSEVFATPEDAKDVLNTAEFFNGLETSIMEGSVEPFINAVGDGNKDSLERFSLNYINHIEKTNDTLYAKMTLPAIIQVLRSASAAGTNAGNENLVYSASHIAKYLWGNPEIPDIPGEPKRDTSLEERINRERQSLNEERTNDFRQDVIHTSYDTLKEEIQTRFDAKNKRLTPFIKKSITDETIKELNSRLGKDSKHTKLMDGMFERARRANFGRESRRNFTTAYLRAAKAILPAVYSKVSSEAFDESEGKPKGKIQPTTEKVEDQKQVANTNLPQSKKIDWSKTSDRDILDGKYVPRR